MTVRLLHSGDLHLGLTRYGHATARGNTRLDDFAGTLRRFVDASIATDADLLILAGDTFDTRHERPEERAVLAEALARAHAHGVTSLICEGNHDGRRVVGDAASSSLRWLQLLSERTPGSIIVITGPTVATYRVGLSGKEIRVAALPYPHKRALDQALADLSPEDRVVEAGRRLDQAIRVMAERAHEGAEGIPSIFVGHLTVGGAIAGSERAMRFEDDVAVSADAFDGYDYAALGHIHRQQQLSARAWYAGSPEYIDFGEERDTKGFLQVNVDTGLEPVVTVIPSGARPVRTVEARETADPDGHFVYPEPGGRLWVLDPGLDGLQGAMVRLRVVPGDRARAEGLEFLRSKVREAGASFVKTEVLRPERMAAEREAVDSDVDPMDATRQHLESRGVPPDRIEAALAIAGQITAATQ